MPYSESNFDNEDVHEIYRGFCKIAQTLRSHGNGSLARTAKKIENDRVMGGDLGRRLLARLRDDKILTLRGGFYYWDHDNADRLLGVSWGNIRKRECPNSLQDYLKNFITESP